MVNDHSVAIAIENPAGQPGSCSLISQTEFSGDTAWIPFSFSARVFPNTLAYLYFVTYNIEQVYLNPTGLRLEFLSAYFTPE